MTLLIDNRSNYELSDEMKSVFEKVCMESLVYEEFDYGLRNKPVACK